MNRRPSPVAAPPAPDGGLSARRRRIGFLLLAMGLPALTGVLLPARDGLSLSSVMLLYLLAVVAIALVGGLVPAVLAALLAMLLVNWFFVLPYHTLSVEHGDNVIALLVFLVVAATVSVAVEVAARQRATAARNAAEAGILSKITSEPVAKRSPESVLEQVREWFGMDSAALVEADRGGERVIGSVGPPLSGTPALSVPAGDGLRLVADGPELFAADRRVLVELATAAGRALEAQRLARAAAQARELEEVDRLRAALLAAVGHDLRTPLAGIKAAVTSLRQQDVEWTPDEREELLATVEESADRLGELVANLLAMSRIQTGALLVDAHAVPLDEVVSRSLLDVPPSAVEARVPDDLPFVRVDPGLLERVVSNLVANARRFSPTGVPVVVDAELCGQDVLTRVVDHGPGVPVADRERMFAPFQRLGDRQAGREGLGLGLAIAKGFTEAMGGSITAGDTPGGGLTVTLTLPVAS